MTVPNGNIVFNSSSGSDTQSSGLGPAVAVYGSGASTIDGTAIVTGIDTTGVTAGDLLWVQSSSGRQFSIIASVDSATQVTCDDTFDNSESGRTWAIGGKRATFDDASSRSLFNDAPNNSVIKTETDQTLNSTITKSRDPSYIVCGNATITAAGNFSILSESGMTGSLPPIHFYDLKFVGSSGNTSTAITYNRAFLYNCQFGDPGASTNFLKCLSPGGSWGHTQAIKCKFYGQGASTTNGFGITNSGWQPTGPFVDRCLFQDFYYAISAYDGACRINRSVITNCNIGCTGSRRFPSVVKTIFYNITGNAVQRTKSNTSFTETYSFNTTIDFRLNENVFVNVGGYCAYNQTWGMSAENVENIKTTNYRYNAGDFDGGYTEIVELTASPFVNPDNNDYSFNNHVGAGQILRNLEVTV